MESIKQKNNSLDCLQWLFSRLPRLIGNPKIRYSLILQNKKWAKWNLIPNLFKLISQFFQFQLENGNIPPFVALVDIEMTRIDKFKLTQKFTVNGVALKLNIQNLRFTSWIEKSHKLFSVIKINVKFASYAFAFLYILEKSFQLENKTLS